MKRNMMTRFSAGCLALLLTFGSVCSVQAAQEPAEPNPQMFWGSRRKPWNQKKKEKEE